MSQSATPALGQLDLAQEALKQLSASSTIQALLRGKSSTDDGSIKQEIPPSPTLQSYVSSYLLPPERNGHVSAVSSASNAAQPSSSGSGHPEEIRVPQGRVSRFESSYAQRRLSAPARQERNVAMYGDLTADETAVTAPSPFRRPLNPPSGQTPARRSYWRLDQSITPASSVPMKRQLSPVSRHRGSVSPPLKKRFAESEASPPRLLIEPRADMDKRLSSPPPYKRSASPAENKRLSLLTKAASASATSTTTPGPNDTLGPNAGTSLSKQRELFLNRELWDVRRQITALRARETKILDELGRDHAPEPAESLAAKNGPSEDKSKAMEAENRSLRDQLQRETLRRKLVEEACENERRRRKLAEDTLDDARREYDEPLVVPAMMDAFERIAQLTGDALMAVDDQKMV
ncbi:hypothetical protein PHLCEN_2v6140 [Hermanssonia centrifuga]|uniref:Uncharacterized protein n=1 Tax=Hermanssonia centrifuga TaxID=98765 RepID=A0A2R6P086_9APHY|nr:hypothetical protein PHLCEN_2v6140 [Hermanssonia centrifuga]